METEVAADRRIDAPADTVYRCIADFENHHADFLPPSFSDLEVEEGGVGAGTVHQVTLTLAGQAKRYRMRVDEPEPGRVLTESEIDGSTVTTYTVEPEDSGCRVRVESTWEVAGGLLGLVESLLAPRLLRQLYQDLLDRLDRYARSQQD